MTASGLSACQPPYCLPRAQTSVCCRTSPRTDSDTSGISTRGRRGCRGGGSGVRVCGCWAGGGCCRVAGGATRRGTGTAARGLRDGPMSSRASRAGACTICGSARPSGRGAAVGWAGAAGGPEKGGRWTVTQPDRAETATAARSVAVVVVRCTRATLLGRARSGTADRPRLPHTGDLLPLTEGAEWAWVTLVGSAARARARSRGVRFRDRARFTPRWRRRRARGSGRRGRCGARTPRSCGCRSSAG